MLTSPWANPTSLKEISTSHHLLKIQRWKEFCILTKVARVTTGSEDLTQISKPSIFQGMLGLFPKSKVKTYMVNLLLRPLQPPSITSISQDRFLEFMTNTRQAVGMNTVNIISAPLLVQLNQQQ